MKVSEIITTLEKLSPVKYACDWDNIGLHVGRKDNNVNKILVSLDIDDATCDYAVKNGVDMIVSHHPLIFKGIKKINDDDIVGKRILTMIENGINGYCMHTNFDTVGGMADLASDKLGLQDAIVLEDTIEGEGIGRVGNLSKEMTIKELCELVKKVFSLEKVVLYGDENETIKRVAICPGSGKDDIDVALTKGAKVLVTGDMSYHFGIDAVSKGISIIDAGHYGIEHIFIDKIATYLMEQLNGIEVVKMEINNPQKFI